MARCAILLLALLGLGYAGLATFRPAWATAVGLDVWNLPELQRRKAAADQRSAELARKDALVVERVLAKDQVVREVLADRMTLLQAAAWFRRLNTATPEIPGPDPRNYPGRTEGERYCRQVLLWARMETEELTPSHAEEIRCRLEAELAAHLASHNGEVVLPEL
jgi:hypothetical protein